MTAKNRTYFFLKSILVLFLFSGKLFSQHDSIQDLINKEKNNSKQITLLLNSCKTFADKPFVLELSKQAYQMALKVGDDNLIAQTADQLSMVFYKLENYDTVSYFQDLAIRKFKSAGNQDGLIETLLKKSRLKKSLHKPEEAFEINKQLIDLAEKSESPIKLADVYVNMGDLFDDINANEKAISYYNKALKLYNQVKDWKGIEACYLKLGNSNSAKGYYDLAVEYYERGLDIDAQQNNNYRKVDFLVGIGNIYFMLSNNERALSYYKEALAIQEKTDNDNTIFLKNNIAVALMDMERYTEAKPYLIEAYFLTKNIRNKADYAFNLAQTYEQLGDYKEAIDYMDTYVRLNDSLNASMYSKNLSETEAKYQNEKKEEQNILLKERLKNKSLQIYFALAGILLLAGLAFFIFRGLRQQNKANKALAEKNKIIEEKSIIVEEQHKDITDSIKYAQRIQQAILPPAKLWSSILPQSFVFYQPKDILSGDFYWIEETAQHVFIAAADCTGHGVPGALMSIVNYNLLNRAVLEQGLTEAGAILDSVNRSLTLSLHQTFQESAVRDGMDVSLCVINKATKQLNFAGAFNSIYIVRNHEIEELIPDKQPVGAFIEDNIKPFKNKYFQMMEGDVIYMFTDGYADQFGGERGKKYKYKNLQKLLLEVHQKPFSEQKELVKKSINDWKGYLEQVDDILLLGYKLD
ncbi:MAG: tetratricopeptide repeat protein [Bacteroidetes bacterium]|nr:tetratricopeptide repeat protein [Bacteroidota bacterium]